MGLYVSNCLEWRRIHPFMRLNPPPLQVWGRIYRYAHQFNRLETIEAKEEIDSEFHANWQSRLRYNMEQLDKTDSLLQRYSSAEHLRITKILKRLVREKFTTGLVHEDLCPRLVTSKAELTIILTTPLYTFGVCRLLLSFLYIVTQGSVTCCGK